MNINERLGSDGAMFVPGHADVHAFVNQPRIDNPQNTAVDLDVITRISNETTQSTVNNKNAVNVFELSRKSKTRSGSRENKKLKSNNVSKTKRHSNSSKRTRS